MVSPLRLAVVGCGMIARDYHGPAIAAYAAGHPGLERVACCDRDAARAAAFATSFGFAAAETDLARMLDVHRPDAVILLAAEQVAADLACAVLERGIQLLMEKPPGASLADYGRIVAAAATARVPVQVAFNRRTMPLLARLKHELAAYVAPGELQHIACDFIRSGRHDRDFTRTLIHAIDAVGFLAGSPWRDCDLRYQELPALGPGVASLHLFGRFANGATATITCCPAAGAVAERLAVHAHGRSLLLELPVWGSLDAPGRLRHVHRETVVVDLQGNPADDPVVAWGFAGEDAAFFDGVAAGTLDPQALASARPAMEIAEAMRQRQPHIHLDNPTLSRVSA